MKNKEKKKTPWPTKKAMEQVYASKLWGDDKGDFYSGEGSHHPDVIQPYITTLNALLSSFENPLEVCDLGCGDFNVGKQLTEHTKKYIAVDIVPALIAHNQATFSNDKVTFQCLDIATDYLPKGDCALVRQVLQHLSNAEIQKILNKLTQYTYVVITEHIPEGDFIPNIDIISGQGTRLKKQSGVKVLAPPFTFPIYDQKQLLTVPSNDGKGVIVTTMYTVNK